MRFDGIIKSWNDERGFGFIAPIHGDQEIFVHIKGFAKLRGRPMPEQRVSFEVELDPRGKKRAVKVLLVKSRRQFVSTSQHKNNQQWGGATLFAIPIFLIIFLAATILGYPPRWTLAVYFVASFITFIAYAIDKAAAKKQTQRISEKTLHIFSLLGGWLGAILAQQYLRHKSFKPEFRAIFWITVVINIAVFLILASPLAKITLL